MIPECPGMHARTQLEENPVLPQVLTQTILKKKKKSDWFDVNLRLYFFKYRLASLI